jgi:drug/metabolite transporter (DMT)-like permease
MSTAAASQPPQARLAMAALIFGAIAIGAAPILVRVTDTGPAASGFWRLVFALPLLLVLNAAGPERDLGRVSRSQALAGLMFALDLACWHYGIRLTSVANATVLPNLTPVLVTIAAWMLLGEKPTRIFVIGMIAAVGGAGLMALANAGGKGPGANPPLGDLLSAATAVWYGLYFLAIRRAREANSATRVMFWSSAVGAPILLGIAIILGEDLTPGQPGGWLALLGLGVVHVAGQGAIAWALGRLPAATAALVVLVQPVAAASLAYVLFREALSPLQALGAALALGGVVVAQLKGRGAR